MKTKNRISWIISAILMISVIISNVYAAGSFSVYAAKTAMNPGQTTTLTISTSACAGKFSISSSNASVVTISQSSDFVDGKGTYTITAKGNGTAVITVTAQDVTDTDLNDVTGSRTVTIKVTTPTPPPAPKPAPTPKPNPSPAPGGTTTPTLSNNAYLSQFRVDQPGMSPSFNKAKYGYAITVGKDVTNLGVTAIAEHNKATVSITGNRNLKEGNNVVTVRVTAQDGKTVKTYTINVTKTDDPIKSNALLENLIITNVKLEPEFSKEVFEYDAGTIEASIKKLDISAFAENEKAKIDIIGNDSLIAGENTIKIIVTSENSKIQRTYNIKVVKEKGEEKLDNDELSIINPYEETGIGTAKGKGKSPFSIWLSDMWDILKSNAVVLLLYAFIWIEVIQVVYLYERLKKQEKRQNLPLEKEDKNQPTRRGNVNEIENNKED